MPARVSPDRPSRNWFHLTKGWKRHGAWRTLTPAHRIVFYTIIDIANELWFPDTVQLYETELADESATSTRTVKRALEELRDAGLLHFGTVEQDSDRRIAVRIRIDYDALTRCGQRQPAGSVVGKSAACRHDDDGTQSECGSTSPPIQLQKEQQNCPERATSFVSEVGQVLRPGSTCPRCRRHPLAVRFHSHSGRGVKDRYLACDGFALNDCAGFTFHLGSTPFQPSKRAMAMAQVGARNIPNRPPLVKASTAHKPADSAESAPAKPCADLSDWLTKSRYLPADLMLTTLADVDPDLAAQHRDQGSDKHAILRDVKARLRDDG
jgi:hypothetical protein